MARRLLVRWENTCCICLVQGVKLALQFFLQHVVKSVLSQSRSSPSSSSLIGVFGITSPFWTCLVYTSCPEAISGAKLSAPFLFSFLFINFWLITILASLKSTFASPYRRNFLSIAKRGSYYTYIIWGRTINYNKG